LRVDGAAAGTRRRAWNRALRHECQSAADGSVCCDGTAGPIAPARIGIVTRRGNGSEWLHDARSRKKMRGDRSPRISASEHSRLIAHRVAHRVAVVFAAGSVLSYRNGIVCRGFDRRSCAGS
jgi:hypothetical protein